MKRLALIEAFDSTTTFGAEPVWLEALPARVYHTPMYGEVPIPVDKLERMVKGFKDNIRGQQIAVDFDHGQDPAKGHKAAGWFKDFDIRPSSSDPAQMSLYASVGFSDEAAAELRDEAWKYFSMEWEDKWMDNDGNEHPDVIMGGAITNRPVAKKMESIPINFSEKLMDELDDETKTKVKKLSEEVKAATDLLVTQGFTVHDESKEWEHSEPGTGPTPQIGSPEQPDPGVGQPVPRIQGDPAKEDPAIGGGWRRDPLPLDPDDPNAPHGKVVKRDEGGSVLTPEELAELKKALGLKDDAEVGTIVETAKTMFSETSTLKQAVELAGEEKKFAETFPTMWREHQDLLKGNREANSRTFSESVKTITRTEGEKQIPSGNGLSALALDTIAETHRKFSEGTGTVADFESAIKVVTNGGIVPFGEVGSAVPTELTDIDTNTPGGVAAARKLFAEKVATIQAEDKLEYRAAMEAAAVKYPDLAAAYRVTLPA